MILIRPVGTHQYFVNQNKHWDDVVEDVIDIFVRTKHYLEEESEQWEVLVYTQESNVRIKSDSHMMEGCKTNEQKLFKCLNFVMEFLVNHWESVNHKRLIHKEEFLIEVKYVQEDFIAELDYYEQLVKRCQDYEDRFPDNDSTQNGHLLAKEHKRFVEKINNSMSEWKKCATL